MIYFALLPPAGCMRQPSQVRAGDVRLAAHAVLAGSSDGGGGQRHGATSLDRSYVWSQLRESTKYGIGRVLDVVNMNLQAGGWHHGYSQCIFTTSGVRPH